MTMVWDAFPASGSQLLAMLAMADWCDDRGGSLYPSMQSVADKIRVSEKQARRLIKELVDQGFLAVVGNEHGGAPGTTKHFRVNVDRLKALALAAEKAKTPPTDVPRVDGVTAPTNVTPPANVTPPTGVPDGSHPWEGRAPTGVPRPLPPMGANPSLNHQLTVIEPLPTAAPPAPEVVTAVVVKTEKVVLIEEPETALQSACRTTWAAYSEAYERRYGARPVRNQSVNAKVKQFVQRIGHEESPLVAAFYVDRVSDSFVVRKVHEVGLLLSGAEGYRTQWAAGTAMTGTRAQQIDQCQSNHDTAGEAIAILRQRRAGAQAC